MEGLPSVCLGMLGLLAASAIAKCNVEMARIRWPLHPSFQEVHVPSGCRYVVCDVLCALDDWRDGLNQLCQCLFGSAGWLVG